MAEDLLRVEEEIRKCELKKEEAIDVAAAAGATAAGASAGAGAVTVDRVGTGPGAEVEVVRRADYGADSTKDYGAVCQEDNGAAAGVNHTLNMPVSEGLNDEQVGSSPR